MLKTLILGLGNDLLSDDAVGLLAARQLAIEIGDRADVVESALCGIALLDLFIGYQRAIVLDAVQTQRCPAGTILELEAGTLDTIVAPSPHYAGLPEMMELAHSLQLDFPSEVRILALEVADPYTIGGALSSPVAAALPNFVARAKKLVEEEECIVVK